MVRSILLSLLMFGTALAGPEPAAMQVDRAARALSIYPPGQVPMTPPVLVALEQLHEHGGADELPLLRALVVSERGLIGPRATATLNHVHARVMAGHRERFLGSLPSRVEVERAALRLQRAGLSPAAASCAAYARSVLGPELGSGPPHLLAALEDHGDLRAAAHQQARRAADGSHGAFERLASYGVDPERLLLGLLALGQVDEDPALHTLVQRGEQLTIVVLSERALRPDPSDQLRAVQALNRMLNTQQRAVPLAAEQRALVRKALRQARVHPSAHEAGWFEPEAED